MAYDNVTCPQSYFMIRCGRPLIFDDFDYDYVRNEILKHYDDDTTTYVINDFVIQRPSEKNGNKWIVDNVDISKVYFDNTRLTVFKMIKDDIHYEVRGKLRIKKMPLPFIFQEYNKYIRDKKSPSTVMQQEEIVIPPKIEKQRVPVSSSHEKFHSFFQYGLTNSNTLIMLDWLENYDICMNEISDENMHISSEHIKLSQVLIKHSEYINESIFQPVMDTLGGFFPEKVGFLGKLFGSSSKYVFDEDQIADIISSLHKSAQCDVNRFSGAETMFKSLLEKIDNLKSRNSLGVLVAKLQLEDNADENYQLELYKDRLLKINSTLNVTAMSVKASYNQFMGSLNKLNELKDVLIPTIANVLQAQANKRISTDTINTIKDLLNFNKD